LVSHVFVFIERAEVRVGHVGDLVVDKRQALMMADIRLAQRDVEGGGAHENRVRADRCPHPGAGGRSLL
jgi:hypothetical protein